MAASRRWAILITVVALFGASLPMITFAIGIVSWTAVARITRAEFLRIRELEFVMASRASGVPNRKLMFGVILPNALPPIIVQSALILLGSLGVLISSRMRWCLKIPPTRPRASLHKWLPTRLPWHRSSRGGRLNARYYGPTVPNLWRFQTIS